MAERSLLAVFAHPDDEAFTTGGTLARYSAAGVRTALVCATRGECGEIAHPSLATPETLGAVREEELRCAAGSLGVRDVTFLSFRDSGMDGTSDNDHPRAFCRARAEDVVPALVGEIRRVRPQIVITFEPGGGYGHPDHIAIHKHATAAFYASGDPTAYVDRGPAWKPDVLAYTSLPHEFFTSIRDRLVERGVDVGELDRMLNRPRGWLDEKLNAVLDVSRFVEDKWRSLECHRTQFGPDSPFRRVPRDIMLEVATREYFGVVTPALPDGASCGDLFELVDDETVR